MSAEADSPRYQDVDVQNPVVQTAIRNMVKMGSSNHEIVKRVGMPHEVVESIRKRMESEK